MLFFLYLNQPLLLPFLNQIYIRSNILPLQLSHFLYLIQINHEALLIRMRRSNTFPTKYSLMIGTVEMLNTISMLKAINFISYLVTFLINVLNH